MELSSPLILPECTCWLQKSYRKIILNNSCCCTGFNISKFIKFLKSFMNTIQWHTLQRNLNLLYVFPEKELCGFSLNFQFLWANYIFPRLAYLFSCSRIGRPIRGIYKSLTEAWMEELGLFPSVGVQFGKSSSQWEARVGAWRMSQSLLTNTKQGNAKYNVINIIKPI